MRRTAITSALHDELSVVLQLLPDAQKTRVAGRDFWVGHLHGREVVAVLCRVGKVAAATTATVLIERFGVQQMLFTGVAGGLYAGDGKPHTHVRVGDLVVAREFIQHDLDASPIFPRYEVSSHAESQALRLALPDALAVEMEGAALRWWSGGWNGY